MVTFGVTSWFGTYTTSQYIMMSTLAKDLAFRLLTLVLLYFNMNPSSYISAKNHGNARKCAGWAGIIFTTCACIDAALRPKYKGVRIFDEIALVCVYVALFAMYYTMFHYISILFMVMAGICIPIGILGTIKSRFEGKVVEPNPDLVAVLNALKKQSGDDVHINYLALIMMAINPEDPATLAVLQMVKERTVTSDTA